MSRAHCINGKQRCLEVTCASLRTALRQFKALIGWTFPLTAWPVLLLALDLCQSLLSPPSDNAAWAKIADSRATAEEADPSTVNDFGRLNERWANKRLFDTCGIYKRVFPSRCRWIRRQNVAFWGGIASHLDRWDANPHCSTEGRLEALATLS